MLTTAALSFIGLGTRPPKADWGTMISVARRYLMSYPWYPLLVGLPLFLTVVFFALAGDAIQDAMGVCLEETQGVGLTRRPSDTGKEIGPCLQQTN